MDDSMSSYSFSHQFYQRWTQAPDPVRAAIVQELTDITTLLQTETPFEKFVFSTHDLDAHLDELYESHSAQQAAAKELADKQAKQRAAAEQQRLAEEKRAAEKEARLIAEAEREAARLQKQKIQEAEKVKKETESAVQKETDKNSSPDIAIDNKTTDNTKNSVNTVADSDIADSALENSAVANSAPETTIVKPKKGAAIDLSLKDPVLSAAHEDLIHELEMHVDDYLSEQMMQISEDLKSWLRAEVGRQLTELTKKDQTTDKTAKK